MPIYWYHFPSNQFIYGKGSVLCTMHVPTQLGTAVFTGTTLGVRSELSAAKSSQRGLAHAESKVNTNTCLCVGNVIF